MEMTTFIGSKVRTRGVPRRGRRNGLSFLEFIGYLIAVVGGAWLGAIYLGVDMRQLAHAALSQAELLDNIPATWRPALTKEGAETSEPGAPTTKDEIEALRDEISSLRLSGRDGDRTRPVSQSESSGTVRPHGSTKEVTRAYWLRLNEIALNETKLQQDADASFNESNAARVFEVKGRISRLSAKAVEAIATQSVDASVAVFGKQLATWYDRTGELYERAAGIWETPGGNQARAQLNEQWHRAKLQTDNEGRLIRERAAAVRTSIRRRFGEELPDFSQPATPVAGDAANANAG